MVPNETHTVKKWWTSSYIYSVTTTPIAQFCVTDSQFGSSVKKYDIPKLSEVINVLM